MKTWFNSVDILRCPLLCFFFRVGIVGGGLSPGTEVHGPFPGVTMQGWKEHDQGFSSRPLGLGFLPFLSVCPSNIFLIILLLNFWSNCIFNVFGDCMCAQFWVFCFV